jgi:hypothetical protein
MQIGLSIPFLGLGDAEHGYRVLRWFIDDAVSGTSARGRDAFEQMMKAAENGRDFETVLCYDISRFSRGGSFSRGGTQDTRWGGGRLRRPTQIPKIWRCVLAYT